MSTVFLPNMPLDFKTATDEMLALGITTAAIAERLGVSPNTVSRARMDPSSPNARAAPDRWQPALREMLREHGKAASALARRI
jgi:CRP-like cAMP-binding protein